MHTMTWAEYFALPAESWSRLKLLRESPAHYRYALEHPSDDTPTLALGRYVHTAILSPDLLGADFAVYPGARRAGKEWDAFAAAHNGRTIFRADEISAMEPIIAAVRAHPEAAALLRDGAAERVLRWTDAATGIACKGRPDYMRPDLRAVIDLKTTASTDTRRFGHDIHRYGYHGQLAHYADGIAATCGWTPRTHIVIAVEKTPPYDVAVFELDDQTIEVGRELVHTLLATLAECRASNRWPGRHPTRVRLDATNLPPWIFGGGMPDIAFMEEA